MKKIIIIVGLLSLFASTIAHAEIEKTATICEQGICPSWWPKLPVIKGWQQDKEQSVKANLNAQAPVDSNFVEAETIIYANAVYKSSEPNVTTLQKFIDDDILRFKAEFKDVEIKNVSSIKTANGIALKSLTFFPNKVGNWEQVSYGEEGEYYLVFTISSRSKISFDKYVGDYHLFVNGYSLPKDSAEKQ
jgi:hypothetical protein